MKFQNTINDLKEGFQITWRASKKYALNNLILTIITAFLPLISLWYIKQIIDIVTQYQTATREDFIYAIITLVIIQLIHAGVQQVQKDIQTVQQQLVIDYLSKKVLQKAISVEYSYYEKSDYYNTLHIAQQEALYRAGVLTSTYQLLLQNSISMLLLAAVFLQFNWMYGLLVIAASVPVLIINYKHEKAKQELEKNNILNERKANYLARVLTGNTYAKEVRTFAFGDFFIDKFHDLRHKIFVGRKRLSVNQAWSETLIQAVEIIIIAAIILNLGLSTLEGELTAGTFIFYLQALQRIQAVFKSFITSFSQLFRQRFFLQNIFSFLELPVQKINDSFVVPFPATSDKLVIKDVSFVYPGATVPVLHHLNMTFQKGKVTAIIGENGSGKSTLVKLLARLYHPTTGSIEINNVNIKNVGAEGYHNNTSVIFQDYNQYSFSLAENITLSHEKDEQRLSTAKADANLSGLIQHLPAGDDSALGKIFGNDIQLSGGQWQKIAIARMLYRDAEIMIMDEPTSNIDPLAEYEILKKITEKKHNKIIILITHRLHNLKFADHVYLMENGKVNGEGTVNELLNTSTLFKQMYERQELEKGILSV